MRRDGKDGERLKDEEVQDAVEGADFRQQDDADDHELGVKYQKPAKTNICIVIQ